MKVTAISLDNPITDLMQKARFKVYRFWEKDINTDVKKCIDNIYSTGIKDISAPS